jgi:hypothetical protein
MKFLNILSITLLSSVILFLPSCGDKEDDAKKVPCDTQGTFSLTLLGGTKWTAASFNNTLLIATSLGVPGKRMDIRAKATDGTQLVITFNDLTTGLTGDCVSASATYTSLDNVTSASDNTFFMSMLAASGTTQTMLATEGTLDITNCGNGTVSGTFTFTGMDSNLNDVIGTGGTFNNVCFTVLR